MFDGFVFDHNVITAQSIWEKIANHLLQQGKQSLSGKTGTCAYHGNDGLKCAIGVLIPENQYSPNIEGQEVNVLLTRYYCPYALLAVQHHLALLTNLQRIHDDDFDNRGRKNFRRHWYIELVNLGRRLGLDTKEIEKKWG